MQCPRCHKPTMRFDMPTPDSGTAWIERCDAKSSCGYWYDRGQLPALHPSFAQEGVSDALFRAPTVTVRDAERVKCPRCEGAPEMSAVQFVGITLDRCLGCRGVWVDRDEYAALMNAMQSHQAEGSMAPTHYRSAALEVTMSRKPDTYARCGSCGAEVPYSDTIYTTGGLVCFGCGMKRAYQL